MNQTTQNRTTNYIIRKIVQNVKCILKQLPMAASNRKLKFSIPGNRFLEKYSLYVFVPKFSDYSSAASFSAYTHVIF